MHANDFIRNCQLDAKGTNLEYCLYDPQELCVSHVFKVNFFIRKHYIM